MSIIAKDGGNSIIPKLEDGVYTAISSAIIDLGVQVSEKFNNSQRKIMLVWSVLNEFIEINGEQIQRTMNKEYGLSLGEKSNLRKDLQAWRGKAFTEEELQGFNLLNILNKGCQLQIINTEKNGKTYNNIAGIMSMPKGTKLAELENVTVFDMEDEGTWQNWSNISSWIQEKIKKAENLKTTGFDKFIEEYNDMVKEDVEENISKAEQPF